ncbi:ABC transporter ATP-binding protein [Devosia sp. SL43]|uniref:ABC transporter ATP-binding protein n=1 Tax=Devosia sp. SL43 TaxID=2806348 RepID=UPI001F4109FE|nr:ABC transporter ATP-binding protein [Devosia sp. SL43]UJW84985.1 ABC transporter ATP-binding protein [Devosia sp. SL43]
MSVQQIQTNPGPVFKAEGLTHSFGSKCVLGDITFSVEQGEFMCIVGPSGIGKTTLLRSLSGLLIPSGGTLIFNGTPITEPPADLAVVFQDYSRSLMPWLNILDNVTLPLRGQHCLSKKQRDERGMAALEEVNIAGSATKYPWQLSGGMQQRAAIARALAYRPAAILMDEPFASVDAQTRADLEDLVLSVRDHLGITVLLVTHDIDEAVYLSDKVCVLSGSPAKVARVIDVDLGRERDQITTKATSAFTELRTEVFQMIRRPDALT